MVNCGHDGHFQTFCSYNEAICDFLYGLHDMLPVMLHWIEDSQENIPNYNIPFMQHFASISNPSVWEANEAPARIQLKMVPDVMINQE